MANGRPGKGLGWIKPGNLHLKTFWVMFGYGRRIFDLFKVPFYDGVYVSLNVTPFADSFFERAVRLLSKKMIYDIDDLVFMGKTSKVNRLISFLKPREKVFYLMKNADHVITCTPYLDEIARNHNHKTTDISSTIQTDKYLPRISSQKSKPLTLGWSGSYSTSPYMKLLGGVLKELKKKHDFNILVIGDENFAIEGLEIEAIRWSEETEVSSLSRIDIGLYPLPNEEWVLGKSGLKALQYMALGIPTVATAIGANFRVIEDGVSGFLVKTESEWLDRLDKLLTDSRLREKIGIKARERVQNLYSVQANEPVYLKIFEETFGPATL